MPNKPIIIGIAGASASGKSLLANTIINELGSSQVLVISEDSYYRDQKHKTLEERAKTNYDHPQALEHELLREHLLNLKEHKNIEVPIYNYERHERETEVRKIDGSHSIIVVEGILLFVDKTLRDLMDIKIYMDAPLDTCLIRRLKRDIIERGRTLESVLAQYEATVRPMYLQFIEPSKVYADLIVPRGGKNLVAIDLIKAKMLELINGNSAS